jgi:ABC-type dipeptide/oligopeptide/nickel transport system ATPase component
LAELQRRSGTAVLFISHDLGIVRSIADHVYVVQRGSIVEAGPTEGLFGAPAHAYTRSLLDAVPAVGRPFVRPPAAADRQREPQPEGSTAP